MKKRCAATIGMLVFCFMMFTAGAGWCENKDNGNGTITDTFTGLVWLKNAHCFGKRDWDAAMSSAQSLSSGSCGLSDNSKAGQWRLPTKDELMRRSRNQQGFTNMQSYYYWSSTHTLYAWWVVDMRDGGAYVDYKADSNYVWPVRAGQ